MKTIATVAVSFLLGLGSMAWAVDAPEVTSCLTSASGQNHAETVRTCTRALEIDPANEAVKKALETARAAVAGRPDVATPPIPSPTD